MTVKSKGNDVGKTGDTAWANITANGATVQITGPMLGLAGTEPRTAEAGDNAEREDGHPVDALSGTVIDRVVDLELPGRIPFELNRVYRSSRASEDSLFGVGGWTLSILQWIEQDNRGLVLRNADGRAVRLPEVGVGGRAFKRPQRLDIHRITNTTFRITELDSELTREFETDTPDDDLSSRPSRLRSIRDAWGNAIRLRYEGPRLTGVLDTAGREVRLEYDVKGRLARAQVWVENQGFQHVSYAYHPTGELANAEDALGHRDSYEYDGKHRMVKTTLKNGFSFHYRYDPHLNECVKTWGDGGLHTYEHVRERHADHTLVTTTGTDEPRIRKFNSQGDLVQERSYGGEWEVSFEYDGAHALLSQSNAAGETFAFEYDARGNLFRSTDPAGNAYVVEHENDRPVAMTGPFGTHRARYDAFGAVIEVVDPHGDTVSFDYDRFGRMTRVSNRDGEIASYAYDDHHNLVVENTAWGGTWSCEYDAMGDVVRQRDPLGNVTTIERDAVGSIVCVRSPDGTSRHQQFDAMRRPVRFTNALGETTELEYVATRSLSKVKRPDGAEWSFTYDPSERLRIIKNPKGEIHEFTYNPTGSIAVERTFDGRRIAYKHDQAGRLRRIDNPDGTYRVFHRDPLGNVVREDSPHGAVAYERDSVGRLLAATLDEGESITFSVTRDELGRVLSEVQGRHVLEHTYDERGRRKTRQVPGCGLTTYGYDSRSALAWVAHRAPNGGEQRIDIERDKRGRPVVLRSPGDLVKLERRYDSMSRLTEQTVESALKGGSVHAQLSRRAWTHDGSGRPVRREDSLWGDSEFRYDERGHLVASRMGEIREAFRYQVDGALLQALDAMDPASSAEGPEEWTIEEGNLLRQTGKHRFEYDACHRRTARVEIKTGKRTEYLWDCRDRLREVRLPDGRRARYYYDALGRRVRKELYPPPPTAEMAARQVLGTAMAEAADPSDGGAVTSSDDRSPGAAATQFRVTEFVWDGDELAAEFDSVDGERGHVHFPDSFVPLFQVDDAGIHVVVIDDVGTVRELVDDKGRIRWSGEYGPWGGRRRELFDDGKRGGAHVRGSPFGPLGQYFDEESGLAATRFRYYDASTGRWCCPDMIGIRGGFQPNAFDGCPLIDVDPLGLLTCKPSLEPACQVYVLKKDGKIVYVGITRNPEQRVKQHLEDEYKNPSGQPCKFDEMEIISNQRMTHDQARNLESQLIRSQIDNSIQGTNLNNSPQNNSPIPQLMDQAGLLNKDRGRSPDNYHERRVHETPSGRQTVRDNSVTGSDTSMLTQTGQNILSPPAS